MKIDSRNISSCKSYRKNRTWRTKVHNIFPLQSITTRLTPSFRFRSLHRIGSWRAVKNTSSVRSTRLCKWEFKNLENQSYGWRRRRDCCQLRRRQRKLSHPSTSKSWTQQKILKLPSRATDADVANAMVCKWMTLLSFNILKLIHLEFFNGRTYRIEFILLGQLAYDVYIIYYRIRELFYRPVSKVTKSTLPKQIIILRLVPVHIH